jgi:hypothetical protein
MSRVCTTTAGTTWEPNKSSFFGSSWLGMFQCTAALRSLSRFPRYYPRQVPHRRVLKKNIHTSLFLTHKPLTVQLLDKGSDLVGEEDWQPALKVLLEAQESVSGKRLTSLICRMTNLILPSQHIST